MNAINLLPAQYRSRRMTSAVSAPFLGVSAGLLVILLIAVIYVASQNEVNSRRSQLTALSATSARWAALSSRYGTYSNDAAQRRSAATDVTMLASARYDWSHLLNQFAVLLPADAELSSLQATSPPTGAGAGAGTGTAAGGAPSSGNGSSIQVQACATSQVAVAQTMLALHRITGVSSVTLSSTADSGATGSGASSDSSGGCNLPIQFGLTLAFSGPAAGAAGASTAAGSTQTTPSTGIAASSTRTSSPTTTVSAQ